jgi:hypothetical protein
LFRINKDSCAEHRSNSSTVVILKSCGLGGGGNHVLDFRKKTVLLETLISVRKTVKKHSAFRIHYLVNPKFDAEYYFLIREDLLY